MSNVSGRKNIFCSAGECRIEKRRTGFKLMNHTKTYYRVIYGDTDAMKIVYNANYLRFFEIGRNEFLRQLGFPYTELVERYDLQLPLAESTIKYKKPARYDDLIEIRSTVLELKNASVVMGYEICRRDTGEILVTGSTKHAFVDGEMKVVALRRQAPELKRAIERFMESGGIEEK